MVAVTRAWLPREDPEWSLSYSSGVRVPGGTEREALSSHVGVSDKVVAPGVEVSGGPLNARPRRRSSPPPH